MAVKDLADVYGGSLEDESSLFQHIEQGLRSNPHGPAVIMMHQPADHLNELTSTASREDTSNGHGSQGNPHSDCLSWTFTQLHEAAMKLSMGLKAQGVESGMRIATFIPNRVEWQLTLWMTTLLRLTLCSVDPGAAAEVPRKVELESFLTRLDPDVIMVPDASVAANIDAAISSLGRSSPKVKIVLDGDVPRGWTNITQLVASAQPRKDDEAFLQAARNDDPDRVAMIMFTSGTSSGQPKGCPRTVAAESHKINTITWGNFHSNTRALGGTANFRIIAPTIHLPIWKAGGCVVSPVPGTGSSGLADVMQKYSITHVLSVPAILNALATYLRSSGRTVDTSCVEVVMLGGDMITRDVVLKAQKQFPQARVMNGHGMTEGGGSFDAFHQGSAADIPCYRNICTVGNVARGSRVRLCDDQSGKTVRRGETGELLFNGKSIIKNYLGNEYQDAFLLEDGEQWLRTGDLAVMDEDGMVFILGRVKDRIKRAGVPIEPAALESCAAAFIGSNVSVIGWPHPVMGHVPLAIVEDLNGKTVEQIKEEIIKMFGQEYALEDVVSLEQLGLQQWPMNLTGKVVKTELMTKVQEFFDGRKNGNS